MAGNFLNNNKIATKVISKYCDMIKLHLKEDSNILFDFHVDEFDEIFCKGELVNLNQITGFFSNLKTAIQPILIPGSFIAVVIILKNEESEEEGGITIEELKLHFDEREPIALEVIDYITPPNVYLVKNGLEFVLSVTFKETVQLFPVKNNYYIFKSVSEYESTDFLISHIMHRLIFLAKI